MHLAEVISFLTLFQSELFTACCRRPVEYRALGNKGCVLFNVSLFSACVYSEGVDY